MPPVVDHSSSRASRRRCHLPTWCSWLAPQGQEQAARGGQEVDTDGLASNLQNLGLGVEAEYCEDWEDLPELVELSPARKKSTLARLERERTLGRGGLRRAGAVTKASLRRLGQLDMFKFKSVRLGGDKQYLCPLAPCTFSCSREGIKAGSAAVHLTKEHGLKLEGDRSASTSSYSCPLPPCPFTTCRQGLLCGHAAIHLVSEHMLPLEQVLASCGPRGALRFRRKEEGGRRQQELELQMNSLQL